MLDSIVSPVVRRYADYAFYLSLAVIAVSAYTDMRWAEDLRTPAAVVICGYLALLMLQRAVKGNVIDKLVFGAGVVVLVAVALGAPIWVVFAYLGTLVVHGTTLTIRSLIRLRRIQRDNRLKATN